MDFHNLKRKALLSLCKKHGIPGTGTNSDLADQLSSLLNKKPQLESKLSKKGSEVEDLKKSQSKSKQDEVVPRTTRSRKVEDVPVPPLQKKKPKTGADPKEKEKEEEEVKDTKRGSRIRAELDMLPSSPLEIEKKITRGKGAKPATVDTDKDNVTVGVPATRSLRTRDISSDVTAPNKDISPRKTRRGVITGDSKNEKEADKVASLKMNTRKTKSGKQEDEEEGATNKSKDEVSKEQSKHASKPQGKATRRSRRNDSVETDTQVPPTEDVPPSTKTRGQKAEEKGVTQSSKVSNETATQITRTTRRSAEVPILPSLQDAPQGVKTRNKKVEEMIVTQESKANNEITTRATRSTRVTEMVVLPDQPPGSLNKPKQKVKEMGTTRDGNEITSRATRSRRVTEIAPPSSQDPPPGIDKSNQKVEGVGHTQDINANNEMPVRTRSKRGREVAVLSSSPVAKKKSKTTEGMTTNYNGGVKKEVSTRSRPGAEVINPASVSLEKKITRRSTKKTDDEVKKPSPVVDKSDAVRTSSTKANVSQKAKSDAGRTSATKANVSQKAKSSKNKKYKTMEVNNIKESTGPRRMRKENENLKKENKVDVAVLNKNMQRKSRKRANEQDDKQGTSPDQEPQRRPSKRLKRDTTTVDDSGTFDGKKESLSKEKVVAPEKEIVTADVPDKTKSQVKKSSNKKRPGKSVSNQAEPEVDTQEKVEMPTLVLTDSSYKTVAGPAIAIESDKLAPGVETESVESYKDLVQVPEHVTDKMESVLEAATIEGDTNLDSQVATLGVEMESVEGSTSLVQVPEHVTGNKESDLVTETVEKDKNLDLQAATTTENVTPLIDSTVSKAQGAVEDSLLNIEKESSDIKEGPRDVEGDKLNIKFGAQGVEDMDTSCKGIAVKKDSNISTCIEGNPVGDDCEHIQVEEDQAELIDSVGSAALGTLEAAGDTVQTVTGCDMQDKEALLASEEFPTGVPVGTSQESSLDISCVMEVPENVKDESVPVVGGNADVAELSGAEGIIATGPDHDSFNDESRDDDAQIQEELNKGVDTTATATFNLTEEGSHTISDLKARDNETLSVTDGISIMNVSETSVGWNAKGADEPVKLQEHACEEPERVLSGSYSATLEDETTNQEGELVRTTDSPESEGHNLGNAEYEDHEPTVEGEASCKPMEEKAIFGMTFENKNDEDVVEDLNEKITHISPAFGASAVDVEKNVAAGEENSEADSKSGKIEDESNTPGNILDGEESSILSENHECVEKGHDLVEEKFGHVSGNNEGVAEGQNVELLQQVPEELVSLKKDALSETHDNVNAISDELLTTDQVLEEPFDDKVGKIVVEDEAGTPNSTRVENNERVIKEHDVELFQQVSEDLVEQKEDGVSVAYDTVNAVSVEHGKTNLIVEEAHDCMVVGNVVSVASAGVSSISPTCSSPNNIEDEVAAGETDSAIESETSNFEEKGNPEWTQHLSEEPKDLKRNVVIEPHADSTSLSIGHVSVNEAMVTGALGLPVLRGQRSDDVGYEDNVPKRKEERSSPLTEEIAIVETDYSNDDGDLGGTVAKKISFGSSPITQALSSAEVVEKDAVELEDNTSKAGDEEKSDHVVGSNEAAINAQDTKHSQIDLEELHDMRNDAVPYKGGVYDAVSDEPNETDDVLERSLDCMVRKDVIQDIIVGTSPLSQACSPINTEDVKEAAVSGANVGFKNDVFTTEGENPESAQQALLKHVDQRNDAVSDKHTHTEFVSEPSMEKNSIQETHVEMNPGGVGGVNIDIVEEGNAGTPAISHCPKAFERDVDILEKREDVESSTQVPEGFNELKDNSCEMPTLSNVEFDQHASQPLERSELREVNSDLAEDDRNHGASPSNALGIEAVIAEDNSEPEKDDSYLQEEEEGVTSKEEQESPEHDDFVRDDAESSPQVPEDIIELEEDVDTFQDVPSEITRSDGPGHPGAVSNEALLGFAEFVEGGAGSSSGKGGDIVSEKEENIGSPFPDYYRQNIVEDDKNVATSGVDYDFEINANSVDERTDYDNPTGISDQHAYLPDSVLEIPGNADAVSDKQFFEAIETVIRGDVDVVSDKQSFEANETGIPGDVEAVSDKQFFEANEKQKSSMAVISGFSTGREVKDVLDAGVTLHQDASFDSWNIGVDETNKGSYISNEKMTQTVYHSEMRVVDDISREKTIETEYREEVRVVVHEEAYQDFSPTRLSTTNDMNEELSAGEHGFVRGTENENERGPSSSNRGMQEMAYDHGSQGEVNVERDEGMNGDGAFAMDVEDGDFSNLFNNFSVSSQQTNEMDEDCDRDRDDDI